MSLNPTTIEWTHVFGPGSGHTWNPITGCTRNCSYCYARKLVETRLADMYPRGFFPTFWPDRLADVTPRQKPRGIFIGSMGDLWDPEVPQDWRDAVWQRVSECPQHIFFTLTKQPGRVDASKRLWGEQIWHGVTVTHQYGLTPWDWDADFDFTSCEPLLERVCFAKVGWASEWVIIGADSSPDANKSIPQPEWVRHIRAEVSAAGIPIFLKDNLRHVADFDGEWREWPLRLRKRREEAL